EAISEQRSVWETRQAVVQGYGIALSERHRGAAYDGEEGKACENDADRGNREAGRDQDEAEGRQGEDCGQRGRRRNASDISRGRGVLILRPSTQGDQHEPRQ